ncbi:MAG TPA: hypothetical protein VM889_08700 [Candidatus Thermoplasmatota archaeon]|nr:hypothetical protein [Candidatus Thermoplasmatota archaeon]
MARITVAIAITASIVLAAAGSVSAATSANMNVRFTSPTTAEVVIEQRWDGQDAADFRQSLDVLFGNRDGRLSSEEMAAILENAKGDVAGRRAVNLYIDGQAGLIGSDATVDAENAVGSAATTTPVTLRHRLPVTFDGASSPMTFNATLFRGGSFELTAPDGWHVASAEGVSGLEIKEDGRRVAGGNASENAVVRITLAEGPGQPTNDGPAEVLGGDGGSMIPVVGIVVVAVAALALAGVVAALRLRRRP